MCKWEAKYVPGYQCDDSPLEGDLNGYCILHSEDENKDIKAFKDKVEERITKGKLTSSGLETDKKIDLIGCYFPGGFGAQFFQGKKFNKPVDFSKATFTEVADFSRATFTEGANFSKATFTKRANFNFATFTEVANFVGATFTEGANFSIATFSEGYFVDTSFEKGVLFDWAEFRERVRFEAVERDEKRVFFGPDSSFQDTRFLGEAVFQAVNLSNCSFLHSNIDKVDFRYCTFNEEEGLFSFFSRPRQNVLRDELEADEAVGAGLKPAPTFRVRMTDKEKVLRENKYEPVRRLYLELKRNFEDKKDWNTAGDFHYGEMECRRKGRLGGWLDFLLVTTYYRASGYGERPWRALLWWFFSTLLFFPFLYRLSEHDPLSACVWDSVRVATFMKIGIPIEPESWGRIVLTLQYFICPTLLALFALALRRKVKR